MGTFKEVLVLCSIMLMLLMGTLEFKSTKSKSHHARRKDAFTDTGDHVNSNERNLRSTASAMPRLSKVDEGSAYQIEMGKPGKQDHTENAAMAVGKTANTLSADHADEMKYGQNSRSGNYNQLREALEAGDVNVDQEGTGGASRKMATKRGTEIKGQHPKGNESDRNKLQNIKREDNSADKAVAGPVEDIHSVGDENEMEVGEKISADLENTEQEGHLGPSVDGRIIEGSVWATVEEPAMPDTHVKEGNQNRNRRRKSTSDNFSPGNRRKPNNVHSNPAGKTASRSDIIDKGRTRTRTDKAAIKPAIENETAENCEHIAIPLEIAIVLIAAASIGCIGTICRFKKVHHRHSYGRAAGEVATPSRQEVRRHDVRSKGRPQTDCREETRSDAAFKSTDGFGGMTDRIASAHDPEVQPGRVNESDKGALQSIEPEEDIGSKEKVRRTEDKHSARHESQAEVSEMADKVRVTGSRDETPTISEHAGSIAKFGGMTDRITSDHKPETKEQPAGVNESDKSALHNTEFEEDVVDKENARCTEDERSESHESDAEASEMTDKGRETGLRDDMLRRSEDGGMIDQHREITCRMRADQEAESEEQLASMRVSDRGALHNGEREENIVVKTKTTPAEDEHESKAEATEMSGKDGVTGVPDYTSKDEGWISEKNENLDTENESDGNILKGRATEVKTVDSKKRGRTEDEHHADNEGNSGFTCRTEAGQEPESEEQLASVKVSDRSALQDKERAEDIVNEARKAPVEDKHRSKAEATDVNSRDDKPDTSEDEGKIVGRNGNLDSGNESDGDKLKGITTKVDTIVSRKRGRADYEHRADNEGFGGIMDRIASDHDPERKEQTSGGNASDKGALRRIVLVGNFVGKVKRRRTEDRHGASSKSEAEASEAAGKDRVTGLREGTTASPEDGGGIVEIKENLHTGNESDGNMPERIATEEATVVNAKRGPADDDRHADAGGNSGIACRMGADQKPESEQRPANMKVSDSSALQNIEREENITNKAKKTDAEDKLENKAESPQKLVKDRVTGVRDDRPGTSQDEGRVGGRNENRDTGNESDDVKLKGRAKEGSTVDSKKRGRAEDDLHADNEGFGGITDRIASDHDPEIKEQPAGVNEPDKGALRNTELVENIVGKEKTRSTEDKHGASNERDAEASETTRKERVTGLPDARPTISEDSGRIFNVKENIDTGNESEGNIPERIKTEGEAVDSVKRGLPDGDQHVHNGGFVGITERRESDYDREQPAGLNESEKGALQNTKVLADIVDKKRTRRAQDKHGASNDSELDATEMAVKDRVTGLRDETHVTSQDGVRIDRFCRITGRTDSGYNPEQLNESEKGAVQNTKPVADIVDKERTRRTQDKHGASNDSELDAAEVTVKDRVTGLRDEKPATSEDAGRTDNIKGNLDTSNESDGNTPERIATEGEAVDNETRGLVDDDHHADNGGFCGLRCKMGSDRKPEAKEQPASVNESDHQNIEQEEDIVDRVKAALAGEKHGAGDECEAEAAEMTGNDRVTRVRDDRPGTTDDDGRIGGFVVITERRESDYDPEQPASITESEKGALQNTKPVADTVDKERTRRAQNKHGASNDSELNATEMTVKDRITGLRDENTATSEDAGRTDRISRITGRTGSDYNPELLNESEKGALQNTKPVADTVDKERTRRTQDKHGASNDSELEATEMTVKDRVTGLQDEKFATSEDRGSTDRFGRITGRTESDYNPEQLNESEKSALQNTKPVADIVDKERTRRTEDKHGASNDSELNATEMTVKDRLTGLRAEKPETSKDGGKTDQIKENLDTSNESEDNIPERIATEGEAVDNEKRGPADDDHQADNGGFVWITERRESDYDPEQPAGITESENGALQDTEVLADIVDKERTRHTQDKHGVSIDSELDATEMTVKDPVTSLRDEKTATSEDAGRTDSFGRITGRIESDYNPEQPIESEKGALQNTKPVADIVDKERTRRTQDKHGASNDSELDATEMIDKDRVTGLQDENPATSEDAGRIDRNSGISCKMNADQEPELEEQLAGITVSDRSALENIEREEDIADNAKNTPAEDKHGSKAEATEMIGKGRVTGVRNDKPGASQDEGRIGDVILQHRYHLRSQSMKLNFPNPRLISDLYTDLRITVTQYEHDGVTGESKRQVREVEVHEILKRSDSNANETSVHVVYGAAGTGKNTLIQKIVYDWATGMKYQEFSFVFHFKIQNLNAIKGRTTLTALILEAYPYLENYLDHLWKEPQSLLFIFDDLDRLYWSFIFSDNERHLDPQYKCSGTESVCFVSDILRCLLDGDFLGGCTVLITTRHWNQDTLRHPAIDSKFHTMGFTSEGVKEYFRRHLRHGQYTSGIIQLIEQSDILQNMCSNPLFCVTLASSLKFHQQRREDQTTMPVINHTQVLFDYVTLLLQECGYDRDTTHKCLRVVGELAYKGIKRNTLSFGADALRELNTCPDNFTTVFMFQDPDKESSGVAYEFRHYVIRDFLAALTHILSTPRYRLRGVLDEVFMDTHCRFKTFLLFLVGLSSRKSVNRLRLELDSDRSGVTSCISEWLTRSVKSRLTNMDQECTQRKFLHTLHCLLELGDNQILTELLRSFPKIKLNELILKPLDCTVLSQTLMYSEAIGELDLSSCLAEPEEIQQLKSVLHRCVILRLNRNNLEVSGVTQLADSLKRSDCRVQILELKSSHLTDDCLETLFSAVRTNSSLTELNLSNSSQEVKHANQFTHEKMQHLIESCSQQKDIRWL